MLPLLTAVMGCKDPPATTPEPDSGVSEEGCGSADWWSAGQPLMLDFCAGCHSSHLSGEARYGAPEGVDLQTAAGALTHLDRIRARTLESGDMPPGGGMSTTQLARLEAWLDCGAANENPLPTTPDSLGELLPLALQVVISEQDEWVVVSRVEISQETFSEEYYFVQGESVWLGGYTVFDATLFGTSRGVLFEPMLQLSGRDDETWTETISAEIEEDGVVVTEEQTWTVTVSEPTHLDGRSVDRSPTEVVMVSDTGEVHAWHLSETRILSSRWMISDRYLVQLIRRDHFSPYDTIEDQAFPFEADDAWGETGVFVGEGTW